MHTSVMLDEVLLWAAGALEQETKPKVLDCTLGAGGHSRALLEKFERCFLSGIDRDDQAIAVASSRLTDFQTRHEVHKAAFSDLSLLDCFCGTEQEGFSVILADLGVSSMQLDQAERGFSFSHDGPLDMRMDRDSQLSALEVVNHYDPGELRRVFRRGGIQSGLGELVDKLVRRRPLTTTGELARVCLDIGGFQRQQRRNKSSFKHPATVVFQALRIEVNGEYQQIEDLLEFVKIGLKPGGRFIVISFQSTEDQLVTKRMRTWERESDGPVGTPIPMLSEFRGKLLTKKALVPRDCEVEANPRSRSARMRVFERTKISLVK